MASKMQGNDAKNNDLNLTPLIDAVFLLLVFFMVTSVFVKATQLKIELPVAENYDQIDQEKKLNLLVSAEGKLEFNGQLVSLGQLSGVLENERLRSGSGTLIVTADAQTPHGFVLDAMEVAVQAGIGKIDLETGEDSREGADSGRESQ
ncbi:MAG: biopolymer transporter ExbD [Gemmatimonadetes bacterium]|jgi:biopolymer transport protein ExbD|nr:biopolymer transporter ExbD [Gemmatimonadota bacterium]MBT5325706.1 biopolymer transporter ExbD [Gemmatimonadota bacterium]MBT5449385.1 biopolymer transporter ExbD [Gemmatimonadota bacterium]MBT5802795.1 biopolymer transporter ExbD [Gemmatimonadota bacterium]MBT6621488.1 biopolymer transporter ExbD [Gemmatimonadota bacterium]|tara:strand:+ start:149 stop:592 length:444 start_codon:yes stop_codon:yes gene_type:complete